MTGSESASGVTPATASGRRPKRLAAAFSRYRTEGATPIRQALSVGLGLYIGASPFIGFHLFLTLALGRLFRLNRLKAYVASNISNPMFAPFLYAGEVQVGAWLRTGHVYSAGMLRDVRLQGLAADVLIGSVVVGLALAIGGSLLTYAVVNGRGSDPRIERLVDAAAARYLTVGCAAWEVARAKLRLDPVYLRILEDGVLPGAGVILDLGCGQGLMLSLLAAAREQYQQQDWPASWPPPPDRASLHGIELRPRIARRAAEVLEGVAVVQEQDLASADLPPCDAVLIFDVLHLMRPAAQTQLLGDIRAKLAPGGVLVLREADAAGGWRFQMVRIGNRINACFQGRFFRPFSFRTAAEWRAELEALGFAVREAPRATQPPFANFLLYAWKGRI